MSYVLFTASLMVLFLMLIMNNCEAGWFDDYDDDEIKMTIVNKVI